MKKRGPFLLLLIISAALYLDDLLVREQKTVIYRMFDDVLFYNNHQIK